MKKSKASAAQSTATASAAPVYDPKGQAQRRREAYEFLLPQVRPHFMLKGGTLTDRFPDPTDKRLRLWIATALLAGDRKDQALGDAIIRSIHFTHACHFCMAWTFAILCRYDQVLRPQTAKHLEAYVRRYLLDLMTADYHFHGANDNAPAECATALVLAGERFGDRSYVDFGRERLGDLDAVLTRRGTIFECNSPTYSAATLTAVSELVEFAKDPEVRRIALRAEQRIWQEVALAFHPETRHQMGPYSRAYEDDLVQHGTDVTYAIYQALGPIQPTNPLAILGPHVPGTINHNNFDFARASALRSVTPDYHIAPETADLFLNKPLPFRVFGSNEFMAGSGFPAGETTLSMYMTRSYGLGTFGSRIRPGQPTGFSVTCRRRPFKPDAPVLDYLASVRHVFCRYVVSEQFNGMMNRDPETPKELNREFIYDRGAGMSIRVQDPHAQALHCLPAAAQPGGRDLDRRSPLSRVLRRQRNLRARLCEGWPGILRLPPARAEAGGGAAGQHHAGEPRRLRHDLVLQHGRVRGRAVRREAICEVRQRLRLRAWRRGRVGQLRGVPQERLCRRRGEGSRLGHRAPDVVPPAGPRFRAGVRCLHGHAALRRDQWNAGAVGSTAHRSRRHAGRHVIGVVVWPGVSAMARPSTFENRRRA